MFRGNFENYRCNCDFGLDSSQGALRLGVPFGPKSVANARRKKMHRKSEHEITVNVVKANIWVSTDFSGPGIPLPNRSEAVTKPFLAHCFYTRTLCVFVVPAETFRGSRDTSLHNAVE